MESFEQYGFKMRLPDTWDKREGLDFNDSKGYLEKIANAAWEAAEKNNVRDFFHVANTLGNPRYGVSFYVTNSSVELGLYDYQTKKIYQEIDFRDLQITEKDVQILQLRIENSAKCKREGRPLHLPNLEKAWHDRFKKKGAPGWDGDSERKKADSLDARLARANHAVKVDTAGKMLSSLQETLKVGDTLDIKTSENNLKVVKNLSGSLSIYNRDINEKSYKSIDREQATNLIAKDVAKVKDSILQQLKENFDIRLECRHNNSER